MYSLWLRLGLRTLRIVLQWRSNTVNSTYYKSITRLYLQDNSLPSIRDILTPFDPSIMYNVFIKILNFGIF